MKAFPIYMRLADLSEAAKVHQTTLERYIYRDVLVPDAEVQHGRSLQPIFLKSRLKSHLDTIRKYRESLREELEPAIQR
jgi:hypothetical protein